MEDTATTPVFINVNDKVSPAVLAGIVGRNVSMLYQWAQTGRLPDIKGGTSTYRECISHLVNSLITAEEAKIAKIQSRASARTNKIEGDVDYEDSMHPLMAAKLKQNIKTEQAREAELWQKIAIKRGEYVAFADKLDLVEAFVTSIRDTLLHIGNNYPDIQSRIDEAMEELFQLGMVLCEEADIDAKEFIDNMLDREVEVE